MMAAGRVLAQGTLTELLRGTTAVVRTPSWPRAFDVLERAGFMVALVGDSLRIADADAGEVAGTGGTGHG